MTALLTIKQLSVKLQEKTIVQQLDLQLNSGEILGLVGESGCGKTTLLNAIAGFSEPDTGDITIDGREIVTRDTFVAAENRQVGMIFQDYALFPHLTVRENIAFGINKLANDKKNARIDMLLKLLKLPEHANKYIHQLSGGQQQRVAIARALAPQPKLLLLDEPFSNIDARLRTELMLEIRQLLKQFDITAIFVTHNKDEVFTFADKMAVMAQGQLLQVDSPVTICQQPTSWQVADFLQLGSWLPCEISATEVVTALGPIALTSSTLLNVDEVNGFGKQATLLMKPHCLEVDHSQPVNAEVSHISVTEQGYHYHFTSLLNDNVLTFNKLSLYTQDVFDIKQQVSLRVKPHQLLIFKQHA